MLPGSTEFPRSWPLGTGELPPRSKPGTEGPLLSIVVPVLNEEETIALFLEALDAQAGAIHAALGPGGRLEVLFIDDGSRDRTPEIIGSLAAERPDVGVIYLSRNFGKDAALAAGLAHARGDAIIPMDVDLQDPPEIIPDMVSAWLRGAKVVNARRRMRGSDTWLKRRTAAAFYGLYNRLADYPIPDNVGDFRLLDRSVVDVLNGMPERIRFMKGLFSWVGFAQATVEYDRPQRMAGTSKWVYWRLWNFALDGITGSTTMPLRIWTYVGLVVVFLAQLYAAIIIARTLILGVDAPGYASMMVVILMFGAFNMISVGLLGEYVGRIAIEVRQRPLYLVERLAGRPVAGSAGDADAPDWAWRDPTAGASALRSVAVASSSAVTSARQGPGKQLTSHYPAE
ncbi:glycosyltransferase family 2 protein [Rhizobium sp. P32RR-XVIII]|uniref:glycosyltransferase family 2 protein n=1 Tax=Rhizobium sp. P32RR-XVIII TaxID=2726738 RepID=UPI00145755B1|nr:glycosyltransferase family 2 protein [Rhizobium sp. P32RR-XVIII]NLS08330.1 glycosyltransferase family 2 protein [Rhizobium sp. P32RR-XVIII]